MSNRDSGGHIGNVTERCCEGEEHTPCPAGMVDLNEGRKVGVDLMQGEQNKKSELFIER